MKGKLRMMTAAERARRNKYVYTINSITRVKNCIDDRIIEKYTKQFSPEYAIKVARSVLKYKGIHNNSVIYDECYSDAGILYMYTIYRCAYKKYTYMENYFKFMMNISIIWNWEIVYEEKEFCEENSLKMVSLDNL